MPNQTINFDELRRKRNAHVTKMLESAAEEHFGVPASDLQTTFNPNACYCNCPTGPCEHTFVGWREFEDGRGGESVCERCGMGAMGHSMMVGP